MLCLQREGDRCAGPRTRLPLPGAGEDLLEGSVSGELFGQVSIQAIDNK